MLSLSRLNLGNRMEIKSFKLSDERVCRTISTMLRDSVCASETDSHIEENMIGKVAWSMTSILRNKSRCANGFITVAIDNDALVGISGCDVSDLVFPNSIQFGIRLWVHPDYRDQRLATSLITPTLKYAQDNKIITWASFNDDRSAMLRMIRIRAADSNPEVAKLWSDFQLVNEPIILFNTSQRIAFRNFGVQLTQASEAGARV